MSLCILLFAASFCSLSGPEAANTLYSPAIKGERSPLPQSVPKQSHPGLGFGGGIGGGEERG